MESLRGHRAKRRLGNVLRYSVLIGVVAICLVPLLWIWSSAMKTRMEIFMDPFGLPTAINFDNFIRAWTTGRFSRYFLNSIYIAVPATIGVVTLATMGGFATAKLRFAGRNLFFLMFLLGLTIPFQAVMIPLYSTIREIGLLNTYPGVILPMIAYGLPFGVFFMRAFFRNLPDELIDAARIDGCNDVKLFWYVMAPLAKPAITTLLIFQFMMSWNAFLMPLLFVNRDALRPLTLGLMFFQGRFSSDYELIFAGITIITLPIVIVYVIFQRYFISGLTAGALK